jgi:chaperone required for assembly of F1-ATPase
VTEPADKPASKVPGREALHAPLPKRFYQKVDVREEPSGGFAVLLDDRPVRTPKKLPLQVPTRALAEAVAAEWSAQTERIDPGTMPLSKIAITTIDGVEQNAAEVAAEIVRFAGSDLLCYRAEPPSALADLQSMTWDPTLRWIEAETGERFLLAEGVMPVTQGRQALAAFAKLLEPFGAFALACLHVMTTLTGSAFLALAVANGRMTLPEAWAAAHLDEDWQIARWGIDVEAADRRERRWQEMQSAGRFLELLAK